MSTSKPALADRGNGASSDQNKPDPVGDSPGGFFDPLPPVSDPLTVPTDGAEASEDLFFRKYRVTLRGSERDHPQAD